MPTQTFFNLPDEKRERILDAAIAEFAENTFQNASISQIIDKAGISRGSFYQYFSDLKDLYLHLFQIIAEKKLTYFKHVIGSLEEMEVFELIREMYTAAIRFAHQQPKLAEIGNNFFKEDQEFKQEILGEFGQQSQDFFGAVLQRGQERGEIDPNVDLKVASFIFFSLNNALVDYYLAQSKQENLFDNLDGYLQLVDQMLLILANGMKPNHSK